MGALQYKCLNCKAGWNSDPPSQQWKCNYCFSMFSKEELDAVHPPPKTEDEDTPELDLYHCDSCGADLLADSTTSATFVFTAKIQPLSSPGFQEDSPRYLIPFS